MNFQCIENLAEYWNNVVELSVELCPPNMTGDLTLNCFRLAKPLKSNPMAVAKDAAEFLGNHADVSDVEIVKAFVNFTLTEKALYRDTISDQEAMLDLALIDESQRKRLLIEYSAPNTNKPLHLGHLRNNSLGMALVEISKRVGHHVIPINLVNDRGVHICKSMLAYQLFGGNQTPETEGKKGDHLVGDFYVKYAQELKKEVAALKETDTSLVDKTEEELFLQTKLGEATQKMLQDWEDNDPDVRALWKKMNSWVLDGFQETYARMGVAFERTYFESDTFTLGKDIIADGLQNRIFYQREDGATEIDLTSRKLDKKVVLRSDGTSVYITQDIGTTLLKAQDFEPDGMVWVVGNEQIYHFNVLFAICKELGYKWADDLYHLAYGMVNLPHGRMKSREGTVVDADRFFDEMHDLSRAAILERVGDDVPDDLEHRAEVIGIGAVKFMLLKVAPRTTMKFDPEAAVKFTGDTSALLQYTYARISSIKTKAVGKELADITDWTLLTHPKERLLGLACANYGNVMKRAAAEHDPSGLCSYLLELARTFNSFYDDCPVVKDEVAPDLRRARLELTKRVQVVLQDGLKSLTIGTLETM